MRRGWDSNPRGTFIPAGFQDRCLQPLGHPSKAYKSSTFHAPGILLGASFVHFLPTFFHSQNQRAELVDSPAILSLEPVRVNPERDGRARVSEKRLNFGDRRTAHDERRCKAVAEGVHIDAAQPCPLQRSPEAIAQGVGSTDGQAGGRRENQIVGARRTEQLPCLESTSQFERYWDVCWMERPLRGV